MASEIVLRCKDDPESNGRKPQIGEQQYMLTFALENGDSLKLYIGKEGYATFATFIGQMIVDDDREGTTPCTRVNTCHSIGPKKSRCTRPINHDGRHWSVRESWVDSNQTHGEAL